MKYLSQKYKNWRFCKDGTSFWTRTLDQLEIDVLPLPIYEITNSLAEKKFSKKIELTIPLYILIKIHQLIYSKAQKR